MGTEPGAAASNGNREPESQPMTGESDLGPEQEAAITALLAGLPGETMPQQVRERLADVLEELTHARSSGRAFHTRSVPTFGDLLADEEPGFGDPAFLGSDDDDEALSPASPDEDD